MKIYLILLFTLLASNPAHAGSWEHLPEGGNRLSLSDYDQVDDWPVHDDRLYVAAQKGIAIWDECGFAWDGLSGGVYMFDQEAEAWTPLGLDRSFVGSIVSHQSYLYAAVDHKGIYRASISIVNPHGKATTTWGAIKTN